MEVGEGEAGDLGEVEPYEDLEEVQVGVGILGLHAQLHCEVVVVAVVHPGETQTLSVQMGWVVQGQKVEGWSCSLQVDVLHHSLVLCSEALQWSRFLSCS